MLKQGLHKKISILLLIAAVVSGTVYAEPDAVQAAKAQLKTKKITIKVGQKKKIKLKKKKAGAKYIFKSSKKKVAKVSKSGVVTGKKIGTARVTVREVAKKKSRKVGIVKIYVKRKNTTVTPEDPKTDQNPSVSEPEPEPQQQPSDSGSLTFRNLQYLQEHYEKHGIAMGFSSPEAYLAQANEVVKNPASLHKLEAEDGDDVYYLESTNDFVIVSTDGYIRTYFRPEDGKAYFDRQ